MWMPTTEDVRDRWMYGPGDDGESAESFDAWLAEERAKSFNRGWEAGFATGLGN